MCGIAGSWGDRDVTGETERMLQILRHRGPDGFGIHSSSAGAVGCCRLAVIDESGGSQPIFNEEHVVAVVSNGEIYNHESLRRSLEDRFCFATLSDTEVILRQYERSGIQTATRLSGMFAFAVADAANLMLSRDPLGIKPLYMGSHTIDGGRSTVRFASELKALLEPGLDVSALPPGCTFTGQHGVQRYYNVPRGWIDDPAAKQPEQSEVRETLTTAVQSQLMSDGPVGVFLSGGLDSSLIAAMARPHLRELHTFTVGIAGSPDLEAARECARFLKTTHHERIITPAEIAARLPEIVWRLESFSKPLVRAAIPNWFCAELANGHVKVVLTGEGADELFGGYGYHMDYRRFETLHRELHRSTCELHRTNLQRADRMTMAHGVEARVPFLDVDVVKCAMDIAPERKIARAKPWSSKTGKWVLRCACSGLLPDRLLWRPKQTFNLGSGVDAAMPGILHQFAMKDSLADYRAAHPRDRIADREEMVFHHLLSTAYSCSPAIFDNVYHWAPDILRD